MKPSGETRADAPALGVMFATQVADYLDAHGVDPDVLLARLDTTRAALAKDGNGQGGGAPVATRRAFIEAAATALGDPYLGLHVARAAQPGAYGLLELVARNAPTVGASLDRIVRYHRVVGFGSLRLSLDIGMADRSFALWPTGGTPPGQGRHHHECYLAAVVAGVRRSTKRAPLRMWFANDPPRDVDVLREAFGVDAITFGARTSGFAISEVDAQVTTDAADPRLLAMLEHYASLLGTTEPQPDDFAGNVQRAIERAMVDGEPTLSSVARVLGTSGRTLQRRLREEQRSFQTLVDEVRKSLALRYVREGNVELSEIAFLLGYAQPHAFWRAFRRWTGQTPAQYKLTATRSA